MNRERLAEMANDIGRFFAAEPDREVAVRGIQNHIQRYWEPRMRRQIIEYLNNGGTGLLEPVHAAVLRLPPPPSR